MKLLNLSLLFLFFSLKIMSQENQFYKDIYYWNDTTSNLIDHRIINIIEYKKNIYCLGKSMDANFENLHPSFSRVSLDGKVQNFKVYNEVNSIYALNALVVLPNEDLRIYGTALSNNKFVPYINSVTPAGVMAASTIIMVNVPHYLGDAKQISGTECVWAKSIRGSATNKYNAFVYRIDMSNKDNIIWKASPPSDFNEECTRLVVLADTSILLLCKRYNDETFQSWVPVIYKMDVQGKILWSKELSEYGAFNDQNLAADADFIYYSNALGSEKTGTNKGNLLKINQKGEIVNRLIIENMNPNGVLVLKSGKILLYGGEYKTAGESFIKKAKVVLFDNKLAKIKERVMGDFDKPDSELPGLAISLKPTSSDFLTAIQLSDDRVALAGRVYMPLHSSNSTDVLLSFRANQNLLLLAKEDGTW